MAKSTIDKSTSPKRQMFPWLGIIDPSTTVALTTMSLISIHSETARDEERWNDVDESSIGVATTGIEKKKVHFHVDDKGEILPDYYCPSKGRYRRFAPKPAQQGSVCVTLTEIHRNIVHAQSYTSTLQALCPEIVSILTRIFQDQELATVKLSDKYARILSLWLSSHGRGLEEFLLTDMSKYRNKARTRILKFQEKMLSNGRHDFSLAL
jgi:hypothetical protein